MRSLQVSQACYFLLVVSLFACSGNNSFQQLVDDKEAPAWAIPFGEEFWRKPPSNIELHGVAGHSVSATVSSEINLMDAIDRVSHAISPWPQPMALADNYRVIFGDSSVRINPCRPGGREPDFQDEFVFQTLSITRGAQILYGGDRGPCSWFFKGNTAQVILDQETGLVEHYETRGEGVKVTWILSTPPPGKGQLAIAVGIAGLMYVRETKRGHHFADGDGQARIRVGPVLVVDSSGRRWVLESSVTGDVMKVHVPEAILEESSYPLAIDPFISPEFGMDEPISGHNTDQDTPVVASNGEVFLVVWQERGWSSGKNLRGARVSASGEVLDPYGVNFAFGLDDQSKPAVASDGAGFLVVWREHIFSTNENFIRGNRMASDGRILDPEGIDIGETESSWAWPSVASDGTHYLVVWDFMCPDCQDESGILGVRVRGADGRVLDREAIPICTGAGYGVSLSVASDGENFLVVWIGSRCCGESDDASIHGTRIRGVDGSIMDPEGIAICTATGDQWQVDVAAGNNGYLVVWRDGRNLETSNWDIYGARVSSTDGSVDDPQGVPINTNRESQSSPALAFDGSNYLVVWIDELEDRYCAARVRGSDLVVLDPVETTIAYSQDSDGSEGVPDVSSTGDNFLVVWRDDRDAWYHYESIYGALIRGADGTLVTEQPVHLGVGTANQGGSSIAYGGGKYFVVWLDDQGFYGYQSDILGVRIDASDGSILDPNGIPVSTAYEDQSAPDVASDGTDFLVVWQDYRNDNLYSDLYGARVLGSDGSVLDPDGFPISVGEHSQARPSVAFGQSYYFVVWWDGRGHPSNEGGIYGARLRSSDGVVLDAQAIPICIGTWFKRSPSVAYGSGRFYVVWVDGRNEDSANNDIYGARVSETDGRVLDPNGTDICRNGQRQDKPYIASDGSDFFVVWEDYRNFDDIDIYGARVDANSGGVIDPDSIAIATAVNDQSEPSVACDGLNYFVVWQDRVDASVYEVNIYGARVTAISGDVLEPVGIPVSVSPIRNAHPCVAYGDDKFLVSYSSFTEMVAYRIMGRFVSFTPCSIGGVDVPAGFINAENPCEECIPLISTTGWSSDDTNSCDDGLYCTHPDRCDSGSCVSDARDCTLVVNEPQCQVPRCDEDTNRCVADPVNEGLPCDDGLYCTVGDVCQAGSCEVIDRDCSAVVGEPQCQSPRCDECSDSCVADFINEGLSCDDGVYCNVDETCMQGECTGGGVRDCAATVDESQCQAPRCDEAAGQCVADVAREGGWCDDGEYCTIGERCREGACTEGVKRDCIWMVKWKNCQVGWCNEREDACVAGAVNEGGSCSDGQYCTVGEKCRSGECVGGGPLDCSAAVTEPQCQVGWCDSWRWMCLAVPVREGESCQARDPCIGNAVCRGGECVGEGVCDVGGGGCGCGGSRGSGILLCGIFFLLGLRRRSR